MRDAVAMRRSALGALVVAAGAGALVLLVRDLVRQPSIVPWAGAIGAASLAAYLCAPARPRSAVAVPPLAKWIPAAWLALCLLPEISFLSRSRTEAASGSLSIENLAEILAYAAAATLAYATWKLPQHPLPRRTIVYLLWPAFAVLSAVWSPIAAFSLVRALQVVAFVALGMLLHRLWLSDPAAAWELVRRSLVTLTSLVTVLTLLALALGSYSFGRLTWPGADSGVAGVLMGAGATILLSAGWKALRLSPAGWCARLIVLVVGLGLNKTRGSWIAVAIAVVAVLWFEGRSRPLWRYLWLPYYFLSGVFLFVVARPQLLDYFSRRERSGTIESLNNRVPLWDALIRDVAAHGWHVSGRGYGTARLFESSEFAWAGTAHNAWVELFVGLGTIGVVLAVVGFIALAVRVARAPGSAPSRIAMGLLAFLAIESVVTTAFALPGFLLGVLSLLIGMSAAGRIETPEAEPAAP
ncbi:MAG TPA: O-antigen ligase family protein [Actinomycetota bacterium]|nr:O-antigen ligase family protein [Actinomycetota bacterium]